MDHFEFGVDNFCWRSGILDQAAIAAGEGQGERSCPGNYGLTKTFDSWRQKSPMWHVADAARA